MLVPKEHGVYAQVACPLLVVLAVSRFAWPAACLAGVFVGAFLLHESVLVLLGRRGPREREVHGRAAWRTLLGLGLLVVGSATAAAILAPAAVPWLVLPLLPAVVAIVAAWRGHEKSPAAQVSIALAFSAAAVPAGVAGGLTPPLTGVVAGVLAVNFILGGQAVRVIVLRAKAGAASRHAARARTAVFTLAALSVAAGLGCVVAGAPVPRLAWLALAVGVTPPVRLAWAPPPPSRLRQVGWALVATSTAVTVLLVAAYVGR